MTISSMNTKSGINGILLCRTKRNITLDLQKQMIVSKATDRAIIPLYYGTKYTNIFNKDHI